MKPKTKIPVPNPSGKTEFENFDRVVRILLSKPKSKCKEPSTKKQS